MATLTNAAGAVVTVPDTEVDFYRGDGWYLPGEANTPAAGDSPPADSATPDSTWAIADLKTFSEEHGIELGRAKKKDDILAAIAAAGDDELEGADDA